MKTAVKGAPIPTEKTVGALAIFGDQQTGKLDFANWRAEAVIDLMSRCEKRDAEAIKKARRGFFGRIFGG